MDFPQISIKKNLSKSQRKTVVWFVLETIMPMKIELSLSL
jgi:hypothetical protein